MISEVIAHLQTPDPQSSKQPIPFFESKYIEPLKSMLSNKSGAPPSHQLNTDEAMLSRLSNSFYGDLSYSCPTPWS